MEYLPTLGEKWPHSRGNVGKYSLPGAYGVYIIYNIVLTQILGVISNKSPGSPKTKRLAHWLGSGILAPWIILKTILCLVDWTLWESIGVGF